MITIYMKPETGNNTSILNIDYVKICDRCRGLGFIEIKDFNTLEPVTYNCPKCCGSGRLHVFGTLQVKPIGK